MFNFSSRLYHTKQFFCFWSSTAHGANHLDKRREALPRPLARVSPKVIHNIFHFFLVSLSSLFFSLLGFPWWRILLFCYFVLALHPPRVPCEPQVCVFPLRAVFFLAFLMLTYFFFIYSLPSLFSISIWKSFVSSCFFFLVGTMLSSRFRFLLQLV